MGIFSRPKYLAYNFLIKSYQDGLDFQDTVVRDVNSEYNLNLNNPVRTRWDDYISVTYFLGSRKEVQVHVYVTDFIVLIGFEESLISDAQVMAVVDRDIQEFSEKGIPVTFDFSTKPISDKELFNYMYANK